MLNLAGPESSPVRHFAAFSGGQRLINRVSVVSRLDCLPVTPGCASLPLRKKGHVSMTPLPRKAVSCTTITVRVGFQEVHQTGSLTDQHAAIRSNVYARPVCGEFPHTAGARCRDRSNSCLLPPQRKTSLLDEHVCPGGHGIGRSDFSLKCFRMPVPIAESNPCRELWHYERRSAVHGTCFGNTCGSE